jgi:TorA maturation chaperone TorD
MNEAALVKQWRQAVASDLRQLAILHSRELTSEDLHGLIENNFPESLGFRLTSENGKSCLDFVQKSLENMKEINQQLIDELAMDFAGIYLNHQYQVSPCESVWFDDENLVFQEAMFAVRECYNKYALEAENWRVMPDDETKETLLELCRFLDEHILRWIDRFAAKVNKRCLTQFYAGINILTAQYLDEMRNMLAELLEIPRETPEQIEKRLAREKSKPELVVPLKFMPGVSPSW